MRRAPLALVCLAATLFGARRARAQGEGAPSAPPPGLTRALLHVAGHLDVTFSAGAEHCQTAEAVLHAEILRDNGYDPFEPGATGPPFGAVLVIVDRPPGGGLKATYAYDDETGVRRWTQTRARPGAARADCEALLRSVAQSITIALTRFAELPPAAPPAPEPSPSSEPPTVAPQVAPVEAPLPPPPPARSVRLRPEIGLGVLGSIGTAPHATVGGVLHAGLALAPPAWDRAWLSFAVEGRADAPAADAYGNQARLLAGSLVLCGSRDVATAGSTATFGVVLCALGTAGVLRASVQARDLYVSEEFVYGAVGARLGLDVRFGSLVIIRPWIEILPTVVNLDRTFRGYPVPIASVAGSLGLAAMLLF